MNAKRFAARALIALAVLVALCMFFARTIQTITTTKVSIVQAQQGRLEQTIKLQAKPFFPDPEPLCYPQAAGYTAVVNRVYARPGYRVAKGDVVFTLNIMDYDEKMDKLKASYAEQTVKLAEEDIKNRKLRTKTSAQNDRYEAMLTLQSKAAEARAQARALAIASGVTLPPDVAAWPAAAGGNEALASAAQAAADSQAASQAAIDSFFTSYNDKKVRVGAGLFDFLLKREVILKAMADIEADMAALNATKVALSEVHAPRDGYVVEISVNEGEAYDGKKSAYTLDNPEKPPMLRADTSEVKRAIEAGAKAEVRYGQFSWNTEVAGTGVDLSGKRYLDLTLNEADYEAYASLSALVSASEALPVSISYRAASSATLIPASALHEEGGDAYIYTLDRNQWGGFMDSGMKVKKQSVTVIDRSDSMVALADDLWDTEIAYREDHPLEDGGRVMEYVR